MQSRFSFKQMKSSQAVIDYANAKILPKIEKFSTKPIDFHVTFSVEQRTQWAHCGVKGGDGFNFEVEAGCDDMYASIDLLTEKLESRLKRQKEKLKQHKFSENIKHLKYVEPVEKEDCDAIAVEASDLIKYERGRQRAFG